jgi:5-methylcytosine-specific restriction endonuclease McrA
MKKLRRIAKDVHPEDGSISYYKVKGFRKPEVLDDQGQRLKPKPNKVRRARIKRWKEQHLGPSVEHPRPTPRLPPSDPAWQALKQRVLAEESCCAFCGSEELPTIDHIIPLALGGGNHRGNLMRLCDPCNNEKGSQLWVPTKSR